MEHVGAQRKLSKEPLPSLCPSSQVMLLESPAPCLAAPRGPMAQSPRCRAQGVLPAEPKRSQRWLGWERRDFQAEAD